MNNKDFLNELAQRTQTSAKEAQSLINAFVEVLSSTMEEGDVLNVQSFGSFEIKKKLERIIVNPATKLRMLVPPKLAIAFKPSMRLKDQTLEE